jgi:hypothetical protein
VQTFLPDPDFARSAQLLDTRRLGKQRVETLQVLRALVIPGYGWRHHPAARMWRGYEEALAAYGLAMCKEWCGRGHADTCADKIAAEISGARPRTQAQLRRAKKLPPWLGDEAFHLAHQSNLVRKDPDFYRPFFPDVPDDLEYIWPDGPPPAS